MSNVVLQTSKLSYIYNEKTPFENAALSDININIEKGELIGIIGHTGSGKSTLIQHFNALIKPTNGNIYVKGVDIWSNKAETRKARFSVGLCFQYPEHQLFEETVAKDISFGPKNMKLDENEINERVLQAIDYVGLDSSYLEKSPFDLSGGEKRRVAIAGVMAMKPEILILDEPCAGLDPRGRDTVLKLIKDYRNKTGSTVMIVSHSMEDVAKIADKVLVLNEGKVAFFGSVKETFAKGEMLKKIGLNIPEITKLFLKLNSLGYDVPTDIYTVEQSAKVLSALIKGGKGK